LALIPPAFCLAACCLLKGKGVKQDKEAALQYLHHSAKCDHLKSQCMLSDLLGGDIRMAAEWGQISEWLLNAAKKGSFTAQRLLGTSLRLGSSGFTKDADQGDKWLRQYVKSLAKGAEMGVVEAQDELGDYYRLGYGVPRDLKKAATWYEKAANQGDLFAQLDTARVYLKKGYGETVGSIRDHDFAQAVKWYEKLAKQGCCEAQIQVGIWYYYGWLHLCKPKNIEKAVKFFKKAVEGGAIEANLILAQIYSSNEANEGFWDGCKSLEFHQEATRAIQKAVERGRDMKHVSDIHMPAPSLAHVLKKLCPHVSETEPDDLGFRWYPEVIMDRPDSVDLSQ